MVKKIEGGLFIRCKRCGRSFRPRTSNAEYCSSECETDALGTPVVIR